MPCRPLACLPLLAFLGSLVAALSACSAKPSSGVTDASVTFLDDAAPVGLGQPCTMNSGCDTPLVCIFDRCHQACVQERDCPVGEQCVPVDGGNVCALPDAGESD